MIDPNAEFEHFQDCLQPIMQLMVAARAKELGLPASVLAVMAGKAAVMLGVTFAGAGMGLPPAVGIPIADDALKQLQAAYRLRKDEKN